MKIPNVLYRYLVYCEGTKCTVQVPSVLCRYLDLSDLGTATSTSATSWATRVTDISRQFVDGRHFHQVREGKEVEQDQEQEMVGE